MPAVSLGNDFTLGASYFSHLSRVFWFLKYFWVGFQGLSIIYVSSAFLEFTLWWIAIWARFCCFFFGGPTSISICCHFGPY